MSVDRVFSEYRRTVYRALRDHLLRKSIWRSVEHARRNRARALSKFPDVRRKAEKLREVRMRVIERLEEYVKLARDSLEDNGAHVYIARDAREACKIIGDIVGRGKIVVKSKTLTSEEIDLNAYLESLGNEVWETDLGELIVQLSGRKPMHLVEPAIGFSVERIAELFSKIAGKRLPPKPEWLALFAREFLRDKFFRADVGISGANVIAADAGAIFIVENEGNARFVTNAPPVHVVLAGFEKIVPTLLDAMLQIEVLARFAGYTMPSYVSIIAGPSKTGDIEKQIVYGAHGPKELHVVLLDNGRSEMAKHPIFREALLCLRCGACLYECPVFEIVAGYFGYKYFAGIGAVWTRFTGPREWAYVLAYTCLMCGRCRETCPMKIDTPKLVLALREEAARENLVPTRLLENLREFGFHVA